MAFHLSNLRSNKNIIVSRSFDPVPNPQQYAMNNGKGLILLFHLPYELTSKLYSDKLRSRLKFLRFIAHYKKHSLLLNNNIVPIYTALHFLYLPHYQSSPRVLLFVSRRSKISQVVGELHKCCSQKDDAALV